MNNRLFSLKGKVAIVTGAARGNGLAIAKGLANFGATVWFVDILKAKTPRKKCFFVRADVTNDEDMKNLVNHAVEICGAIDILVNNAGITKASPSKEYSLDDWDKTMDTNLRAPFRLSQLVARQMINQKTGGSIINIASLNARFGFSDNPAYVASKGGLSALTRALAKDWAKYGIRVNSICPGYIHTAMTEKSFNDPKLYKERIDRSMIKRYGEPEDLIGAAVFLASDASNYITGIDIYVDGGWSTSGI
ncbi:MAG: SDR family oxidoreductase [Patescibacteria group bacterium]